MIYDGTAAIDRYRGLYRGLDALIDWLAENDPADLSDGCTKLRGDLLFANVMRPTTRRPEDATYEVHHDYMDVQMDLEGAESFRTTSGPTVLEGAFDEKDDFALLHPEDPDDYLAATLGPGRFALFVVGEPHMPTVVVPGGEPEPIRKVWFKLAGDRLWEKDVQL